MRARPPYGVAGRKAEPSCETRCYGGAVVFLFIGYFLPLLFSFYRQPLATSLPACFGLRSPSLFACWLVSWLVSSRCSGRCHRYLYISFPLFFSSSPFPHPVMRLRQQPWVTSHACLWPSISSLTLNRKGHRLARMQLPGPAAAPCMRCNMTA